MVVAESGRVSEREGKGRRSTNEAQVIVQLMGFDVADVVDGAQRALLPSIVHELVHVHVLWVLLAICF